MSLYVATIARTKGRILTDGCAMRDGKQCRTDLPKARTLPGGCILVTTGSWAASEYAAFLAKNDELHTTIAPIGAAVDPKHFVCPFEFYMTLLLCYAQAHPKPDTDKSDAEFFLVGPVNDVLNVFCIGYAEDVPPEPQWHHWREEVGNGVSLTANGWFRNHDEVFHKFRAINLLETYELMLPETEKVFYEIRAANRRCIGGTTFCFDLTLENGELKTTRTAIPDISSEALLTCEASGTTRVALAASHSVNNIAYNFKGAWSNATSYVISDEVTSGNIYWIALAPNTNSQPSITNGNWQAVGRIQGDVQTFTGSGTWSKPAAGTFAIITCIGGGSGGAGGGKNTAGNGGFAGGISVQTLPLSILGATESVTIGGGGSGGAGSTVASSNPGGTGGQTSFGSWLRAAGGTSSAAGGGNMDNGTFSMQGGNGGNGGGPPNTGSNGADGASARTTPFTGGSGGTGALNLSGNATASPGGNGTAATNDEPAGGGGGGGGGGASCGTSAFTATGGNGGNGAIYGAGGGGGGGAVSSGTAQGGTGGSGASGLLVVAVY